MKEDRVGRLTAGEHNFSDLIDLDTSIKGNK